MNKIIIYISYDCYEYIDYFHLVINDELLLQYCKEGEIESIFETINQCINSDVNSEIVIMKNEKVVYEWDYIEEFCNHNIMLEKTDAINLEEVSYAMKSALDNPFEVVENEIVLNNSKIIILFSGNCILKKDGEDIGPEEVLDKAREIIEQGGHEMTELARIIKEKYERMSRNE